MKKILLFCLSLFVFISLPASNVGASGYYSGIIDTGGHLSAAENSSITQELEKAAEKTEMNIIIYLCDDVGSDKSDDGTVDHADVMYESICGKNTDGVLLLINFDTKYDYISTSGSAINYFSDYRIDLMFDFFYDDLVDERYADACYGFIDSVVYYQGQGKDNHQVEVMGREFDTSDFTNTLFVMIVIAGIVGLIVFFVNKNKYKLQKANTRNYIVNGSMLFNQNTDTYVGTIVNRIYSPQSSGGSGGGGGGSHGSSTHHSSGGGRHGGGGRHR